MIDNSLQPLQDVKYSVDVTILIPEDNNPDNTHFVCRGNPVNVMSALISLYVDLAKCMKIPLDDLRDVTIKNLTDTYSIE